MKSYFPKAPVEVVAGGLAANYTDEKYGELLEQMANGYFRSTDEKYG
jgi:hypothetical protein